MTAWQLQASSLPFIVAVEIGIKLSELNRATGAVPVVAELLSVALSPNKV